MNLTSLVTVSQLSLTAVQHIGCLVAVTRG